MPIRVACTSRKDNRDGRQAVPQELIRSFQCDFLGLDAFGLGQRHGQDPILDTRANLVSIDRGIQRDEYLQSFDDK
jgi:hypothetical protein